MSVETALPSYAWNSNAAILTFVIPAFGGCDLACPYCYIDQRGESDVSNSLRAVDYVRFVREIVISREVASVCVQGYEPLLPASFPFTHAILKAAQDLCIPASLVTNGTHLAQWVDELAVLAPGRISVSLDAAEAEAHDRQRRKRGAFASTVDGLRRAVTGLPAATELVVTSVLIPKRRGQLDDMPALLNDIGIKRWVVTALQKVGKDRPGGPVGEHKSILADLRILSERAHRAGIDFRVDDEFDGLADVRGTDEDEFEKNRIRRLVNPDGVYRLVPDGRCSKGADILKPLAADAPRWDPKTMDAGAFLRSL
jgi:sulfatase maturation enzyme AslB (radical SAM superfamily)